MIILAFYALLAIGVSFYCSLLEASLLSVPRGYVQMLLDRQTRTGRLLHDMKQNIDRPLAAILTLNTIANTVGSVGVGAQAAAVFDNNKAVGLACALLTLLILVVSEIIPKTLGAEHAKNLAPLTARSTWLMILLLFPLIASLEQLRRLMKSKRTEQLISRAELMAQIRLGQEGGALRGREYKLVSNLMALTHIRLIDVVTPRTVMFALQQDLPVGQLMQQAEPIRYARIPIYDKSLDDVIGYVARFDLYKSLATESLEQPLKALVKPIAVLPELASIADALEKMLNDQQQIALVVDEYGGTTGIVTLEDLLESLLGQEIVDETDLVVDMQAMAKEVRNRKDKSTDAAQ